METVALLSSPYLSLLLLFGRPRVGRVVARHTRLTLPVGWIAVLAVLAAVVGVWSPPALLLVVCATLTGLAMVSSGGGGGGEDGGDDGPGPDDDLPPAPPFDWGAFDEARRGWDRERRPTPA